MKLLTGCFLGVIGLLVGCSSAPLSKSHYYLLNNQQAELKTNTTSNQPIKPKEVMVLSVKDLPEYLNQPHLVMKIADHKLNYAHFHLWAEPLQLGLKKALLAELNANNSESYFIAENRDSLDDNLTSLVVNIDYFHPTSDSLVTLSGQYWLSKANKDQYSSVQPFYFEQQLEQDGYPHSVAKMRALVAKLAVKIMNQL